MTSLPNDVVAEDRRLDETQHKAAEALMRLRWHWTLDESNADRVSFRAYADAVGKVHATIQRDAKGYVLMQESGSSGRATTPNEARGRANMSAETEAATDAVAKARGVSFQQARQARPVETRRVREIARQRAEDKGTSVEEEAPKVAETIARREQSEAEERQRRAKAGDLRFVEMEQYLDRAKRPLYDALKLARDIEWTTEHRELLEQTLANIRSLLGLIDIAIVGETDVDWDAELSKITEA
jgi:hypothetical protein